MKLTNKLKFFTLSETHINILISTVVTSVLLLSFLLPRVNSLTSQVDSQKQVVSVDLLGLNKEFILKIAESNLEQKQIQVEIQRFYKSLELVLQQKAEELNLIIVPKQAIVAGVQDITPQVQALLNPLQRDLPKLKPRPAEIEAPNPNREELPTIINPLNSQQNNY